MELEDLRRNVGREMEMADEARAAGREGRARVCARRAAGLAALHRLEQSGTPARSRSALEALKGLAAIDELPPALRKAVRRLTTHVTEDHVLPHEEDPLADARLVISACLRGEGFED